MKQPISIIGHCGGGFSCRSPILGWLLKGISEGTDAVERSVHCFIGLLVVAGSVSTKFADDLTLQMGVLSLLLRWSSLFIIEAVKRSSG